MPGRPFAIIAAFALAFAIAGCSSGASPSTSPGSGNGAFPSATSDVVSGAVGEDDKRYSAYYEKCQEYLAAYGEPGAIASGPSSETASGLALVRLVDFDGDGLDELLLGYVPSDSKGGVEVWSYRDAALVREYRGDYSLHGTNGFFPYVEVASRSDREGSVLFSQSCLGSAPPTFSQELCGYSQDGAFGVLARRAYVRSGSAAYYICPTEGDAARSPGSWREVAKADYDAGFGSIYGEQTLHLHLYEEGQSGSRLCESGSHLDETIAGTRETISLLSSKAS